MRFSKQREEILKIMQAGILDHPTAQQVHDAVREILPDLSLGTVYRNLHQLAAAGDLREVAVGGALHYDTNLEHHHHLVCVECGCLKDLVLDNEAVRILTDAAHRQGHTVLDCDIHVRGKCADCAAAESSNTSIH